MRELRVLAVVLFFPTVASATTPTFWEQVPTTWQLQNYVSGTTPFGVHAWSTGVRGTDSNFCGGSTGGGHLFFPTGTSEAMQDRFWSIVTTAKLTGRTVFVTYDATVGSACGTILDFGLRG